jgi:hypothetical protein
MRKLPALLVLGTTALAGCGDAPAYVRDRDGVLHFTLDEYRVRPQYVSVRPGTVRLVARDRGRLTHNLAVEALDRRPGEQRVQFGRTPTAHPGQTVAVTLRLRPGKYRIACTIANHDDLGQFGELQVTGG